MSNDKKKVLILAYACEPNKPSEPGVGWHLGREISEFMIELGDKMNHSTARNVFMSAMTKLSNAVINIVEEDSEFAKLDPELAAKDPRFQSAIESYLREMCTNKES